MDYTAPVTTTRLLIYGTMTWVATTTPFARAESAPETPAPANATSTSTTRSPAVATTAAVESPLPAEQTRMLGEWYAAVGAPRRHEGLGHLAVRAGMVQLGKPYYDPPPSAAPEALRVELASFQCVSFVESSLALARCLLLGQTSAECFVRELTAFRYRDGNLDGFASRMHYYSEWFDDNSRRGRVKDITAELGGVRLRYAYSYLTSHKETYPALADPTQLSLMATVEKRLSTTPHAVIERAAVAAMQRRLETGDILAIVGDKPGLLVSHTGLVARGKDGVVRLLHASSYHRKVMLTPSDVADYVLRREDRRGLMVARPLAP